MRTSEVFCTVGMYENALQKVWKGMVKSDTYVAVEKKNIKNKKDKKLTSSFRKSEKEETL